MAIGREKGNISEDEDERAYRVTAPTLPPSLVRVTYRLFAAPSHIPVAPLLSVLLTR